MSGTKNGGATDELHWKMTNATRRMLTKRTPIRGRLSRDEKVKLVGFRIDETDATSYRFTRQVVA